MDDSTKKHLPFINDWHELIHRYFDDPFTSLFRQTYQVDVYDMGTKVVIKAELPGFEHNQIKIESIHEGVSIIAEDQRELETIDSNKKYFKQEHNLNRVERIIPLPFEVTPQNTKAQFKNGILEIEILKKAKN